jgi:hypothetical protein
VCFRSWTRTRRKPSAGSFLHWIDHDPTCSATFGPADSREDGPEAIDVKRLRQLEQENAKLKLIDERDLEVDVMNEVAEKNGGRARASSRV